MIDHFKSFTDTVTAPARKCFAITPDDAQAVQILPKAIYCGTGGNLTLRAVDSDADVTLVNVPVGVLLPIRAKFIRQAGTTAGDIVGVA